MNGNCLNRQGKSFPPYPALFRKTVPRHFPSLLFVLLFLVYMTACAPLNGGDRQVLSVAAEPAGSGECPQKRVTLDAPGEYLKKTNPLPNTGENLQRGRSLYEEEVRPITCKFCHGIRGNGLGIHSRGMDPPPRNFTCSALMRLIPDGQLFWVILKGSEIPLPHYPGKDGERPGRRARFTLMPSHESTLTEEQAWQLVMYIRSFAK